MYACSKTCSHALLNYLYIFMFPCLHSTMKQTDARRVLLEVKK